MSEPRTAAKCPTPDRLRTWLQGKVTEEEQDRIAAHVQRCPACEAVLESFDGGDDSVVRDLRGGPQDTPPVAADLERLLRRAEALGRSGPREDEPESEQASLATKLGGIVLLEPIGRGGMGVVYKALHRNLKMHVAVKVLPPDHRKDSRAAARFQREMEAAGRLVHENLVRAHHAGEAKGRHYLVMEFIEGEDLQTYVRRNGPLPVAEACELVRQAALGLGHAHASGLVHRDVKPSNLMRTPQGTVKVLDLGLARIVDTDDVLDETASPRDAADETVAEKPLTRTAHLVGTIDYIAPEQAADSRTADERSDIYSLGCTLYFLLTRFPPFGGPEYSTFEKKRQAHLRSPIVPLQTLCPDAPLELSLVVQAMLAKKPGERPQSMREVADLMRIFAPRGESSTPAETERALREVRRRLDRRRIRTTGLAGVLLLLTVAVAIVYRGAVGDFVPGFAKPAPQPVRPVVVDRPPGVPVPNLPRPPVRPAAKSPPVVLRPPPADRRDTPIDKAIAAADPPPVDALGEDGLFDATRPRTVAEARVAQQQWAERLGEPVEKVNSVGMTMVLIPPGRFAMGSAPGEIARVLNFDLAFQTQLADDEQPPHRVGITRPLRIARHEVTVGQFRRFVAATQHRTWAETDGVGGIGWDPSKKKYVRGPAYTWDSIGYPQTDEHPVANVAWDDAVAFCTWLGREEGRRYRLPTEAEWEFACRAGTTTFFHEGDDDRALARSGNFADGSGTAGDGREHASRVGTYVPNAWGLRDMHGNVWEWCSDWYDAGYYVRSPSADPGGPPDGTFRVYRGGSFQHRAWQNRSAVRTRNAPTSTFAHLGFRVVAEVDAAGVATVATPKSVPAPVVPESDGLFDAMRPRTAVEAAAAQRQWAERLAQPVESTNSIGMRFAVIPPGRFTMGSPPGEAGRRPGEDPVGVVLTRPFRLAVHETTQGQWTELMGTTPWAKPPNSKSGSNTAATGVSWRDATEFCRRLTERERNAGRLPADVDYRLPTEAEWEYACRAGSTTAYWFGGDASRLGDHAWWGGFDGGPIGSERYAQAVGLKRPNPWGLVDVHGNVGEWCADWYGDRLPGGIDPKGPSQGSMRVTHGGGWPSPADHCRSAFRSRNRPDDRNDSLGFRVVMTVAGGTSPATVADVLDADGLFDATRQRPATETQAAQRQWADRLAEPVEVTNSIGMRLAVVPPGRFSMGSPATDPHAADNERPQVSVTISQPFRISAHETTQRQWESVKKSTPWMKGSLSRYYARRGADLPATYVSWVDSDDFCRRLTDLERRANRLPPDLEYALPTEAQWEYACRAGTTTAYSFGDDPAELGRHAWYGGLEGNGNAAKEQFAHAVGSKQSNAWGLFDMHGNAWEFCRDGYTPQPRGGTDPYAPHLGDDRVLRGGGWDLGAETLRSANRLQYGKTGANGRRGFRVVVTAVRPAGE